MDKSDMKSESADWNNSIGRNLVLFPVWWTDIVWGVENWQIGTLGSFTLVSDTTQFSQEWVRRKVVVKHSIQLNKICQ